MKPHLNKGLFSNYYLEELLPREEEFKIPLPELGKSLEEIKRVWGKKHLSSLNEPQLRKHFLDKVFEILGWTIDVEPPTPSGEWSRHPDYALFHNPEDLKLSQEATKEEYFKKALCLGEAKHWGRALDKKVKVDTEDPQNPSLQISRYLWLTEVKWGILTDGRYWRLYERETSKRLDIFYEIDLEDLIENGSIDDFKYFCLFFRRDAFPVFLEKVYKESVDYAEAVGKELKENVYQALKTLAQGFLKTPGNGLKEIHLKEIHDNSLILLYRLLFILYAEYRDLLPLEENQYYTESYSLDAFKKEISDRLDKHEPIATSTHGYWNKLKELFEIINIGNSELGVPPYNGGLFDPSKHQFLEKYRVGDLFIAKAVDLLSRSSDRAYIDYGSLEIRHLGSIYEGLLEYKLKIAKEKLVPVKQKSREVFIPLGEAKKAKKKIKEEKIVREGEIYLATDKGERKATGSYYTPGYIVNYIIENTLGPLIERIYKEAKWVQEIKNSNPHFNEIFEEIVKERGEEEKQNLLKLWNLTRNDQERRDFLLNLLDGAEPTHRYDPLERILQLKILDPAMGSGHFLVEATDFLARELLKVLSGEPLLKPSKEMMIREAKEPYGSKEPEEEDIRWARREVVERCIFGVDLNPLAVELAKLSLWLYTVAKNRPLNFLDHHLRCGNSLIGSRIENLASPPSLKKKKTENAFKQLGLFENAFREKVAILLKSFDLIEAHPSDTVEQIRGKESYYKDFRRALSRFQDVADVWTSIYFGIEIDFGTYQKLQNELRATDAEWKRLSQEPWFKKAKDIADEKRFFHWELEFPEVFFEGHHRKKKPGFDALVGNPPYIRFHSLNTCEIPYFAGNYDYATGQFDAFVLMLERGLYELNSQGRFGFIMPDLFLRGLQYERMRKMFLQDTSIKNVVELGDGVFPDVQMPTCLFLYSKSIPRKNNDIHLQLRVGENKKDYYIKQHSFLNIPGVPLDPEAGSLVPSVMRYSLLLEKISTISRGIEIGKDKVRKTQEKDDVSVLSGDEAQRYVPEVEVFISKEIAKSFSKGEDIFEAPKIMIRETGGILLGCFDSKGLLTLRTLHNVHISTKQISEKYVLSLLNSRLLQRVFEFCFKQAGDIFPKIRIKQERQLPIRHISFVTPKDQRKRLVDDAKAHYEGYLEARNPDNVLYFIESQLIKRHKPAPELLEKHNTDPLNKDWQIPKDLPWERTDVVHDTLAYLAEQMIEMNNEKQEEIKGLLKWLENQLNIQLDGKGNVGIEALTGKSKLKNYLGDYQKGEEHLSFDDLWKILEANKTRIQTNLKSREFFDVIKTEYEKSLSRLLPVKEKLRKTDWLIDQIVYKLYGLTEEEIGIVEGQK